MAYTLSFSLALGTSQTGLTLSAQLVDSAGVNVGGAVGTGFSERGRGNYLWTGSIPDGHRGGVEFFSGAILMAFSAINPEEAEYTDAKTSTRLATAGYTTPPTVGAIADGVWDEALAGHLTAGTTGEALDDAGNASTLTAADVWDHTPRTLTQSAASVAATVAGSSITVKRGDSWSISLTNIGALTGYTKLWFTVKRRPVDADFSAVVQIVRTASPDASSLVYVNGATAATPANGTLTIDDAPTGDITITLQEAETANLTPGAYTYDVQVLNGGNVVTLTEGTFTVTADVTRAVA